MDKINDKKNIVLKVSSPRCWKIVKIEICSG